MKLTVMLIDFDYSKFIFIFVMFVLMDMILMFGFMMMNVIHVTRHVIFTGGCKSYGVAETETNPAQAGQLPCRPHGVGDVHVCTHRLSDDYCFDPGPVPLPWYQVCDQLIAPVTIDLAASSGRCSCVKELLWQ